MKTDYEIALACFGYKKAFVQRVSAAISFADCGNICNVRYEVFENTSNENMFQEFIIVTYYGGEIAVRNVNMDSHSAILCEIAKLASSSYYDEVKDYYAYVDNPKYKRVFY